MFLWFTFIEVSRMRYARIPSPEPRRWRDIAADASSIATLFAAGAVIYQLLCPLDAYAAAKPAQVCMTEDGYVAMIVVWALGGACVTALFCSVLAIAYRSHAIPPDGFGAGGYARDFDAPGHDASAARAQRPTPPSEIVTYIGGRALNRPPKAD